jgi:hypothetical protein
VDQELRFRGTQVDVGDATMRNRTAIVAALAAVVLSLQLVAAAQAQAQVAGRYRIDLMNGQAVEGDVKELPNGSFEVKTKFGVVVTIKKSEVRGLRALEAATTPGRKGPAGAGRSAAGLRREISDAEVTALLAGIVAQPDESLAGADRDEMLADLPVDDESLADMKRIAGPESKVLLKPHFVMVYTSTDEGAQKLAARLEAIFRWKIQFMKMMGRPVRRPPHKLEIYYVGTYKEFQQMGAPSGAAGFYRHDDNRAYFFDFEDFPVMAALAEKAKDPNTPWRERQRLRNRISRYCEDQTLEVIQHEAGHQIDFNIGLFPRYEHTVKADYPRWLVEGTTMMFEVPPSSAGASLGVLNHTRLDQLRLRWGRHPLSVAEWKRFIIDNNMWFHPPGNGDSGDSYPLGWALVYYLWKEHRAGYAQYCKAVYNRDEDVEMSNSDREKEFEDIFGRVDEKWVKSFYDFLDSLQLRKSLSRLGGASQHGAGHTGRGRGGQGAGQGGKGGGGSGRRR